MAAVAAEAPTDGAANKKKKKKKKKKGGAAAAAGGQAASGGAEDNEEEEDEFHDAQSDAAPEAGEQPAASPTAAKAEAASGDAAAATSGNGDATGASAADKKKRKKKKKKKGGAAASATGGATAAEDAEESGDEEEEEGSLPAAAALAPAAVKSAGNAAPAVAKPAATGGPAAAPEPAAKGGKTAAAADNGAAAATAATATADKGAAVTKPGAKKADGPAAAVAAGSGNKKAHWLPEVDEANAYAAEPDAACEINVTEAPPHSQLHGPFIHTSVAAKGKDHKCEDKPLNYPANVFKVNGRAGAAVFGAFGVFDGHGGKQTAQFAAKQLVPNVMEYAARGKAPMPPAGSTKLADPELQELAAEGDLDVWAAQECLVARLPQVRRAAPCLSPARALPRFAHLTCQPRETPAANHPCGVPAPGNRRRPALMLLHDADRM